MGRSQNIDIGSVLATGRELVVDEAVDVPSFGSFAFPSPAQVAIRIGRVDRTLDVTGTVDIDYEGSCDRCLEPVRRPLHLVVDERFPPAEAQSDPLAETNVLDHDGLDVADLVRQLVDAALPMTLWCESTCPGLCQSCGTATQPDEATAHPSTKGNPMANLKWKTPRSKTRSRRAANWQLIPVTTVACSQCHRAKRPHFVCGFCGYYDGRQVIEPKDDHAGHQHT